MGDPQAPLQCFLNRVSDAFKKLSFALDLDEREPLPADADGIPSSRVNRLMNELHHSIQVVLLAKHTRPHVPTCPTATFP